MPAATLHVAGRFLNDRSGKKIVLRGVNYPLLDDWNFPGSSYLKEIAQTGANAIRIQWYVNYPDAANCGTAGNPHCRPACSVGDLGRFIDSCVELGIIPIVMLADLTCNDDPTLLNSKLIPWWVSAEVMNVLKPRQACLILNLANELGAYKWADGSAGALATYHGAYAAAIAAMRHAGYVLPLMIDAPDCGTTLEAFTMIGADLVAADPMHNILLSTHAYWAANDGRSQMQKAVSQGLPIVFGEIANKQDENGANGTEYGFYDLDGTKDAHPTTTGYTYQEFLRSLLSDDIGWLAWCWTNDNCSKRQMSNDGSFASLTGYGNDLVHNATYGLKTTASRISTLP